RATRPANNLGADHGQSAADYALVPPGRGPRRRLTTLGHDPDTPSETSRHPDLAPLDRLPDRLLHVRSIGLRLQVRPAMGSVTRHRRHPSSLRKPVRAASPRLSSAPSNWGSEITRRPSSPHSAHIGRAPSRTTSLSS